MRFVSQFLGAWILLLIFTCLLFGWAWCIWAACQYTFLGTGNAFLTILAGLSAFFMPMFAVVLALSEDTPAAFEAASQREKQ